MAHEYIEEPENTHQEPLEILQDGEWNGFSGCQGVEQAVEGKAEGAAQCSALRENGQQHLRCILSG